MKLNKIMIILSILSLIIITSITADDKKSSISIIYDSETGEQQIQYNEIIVSTKELNVKCGQYDNFIKCDECNYDGNCDGIIQLGINGNPIESYFEIDITKSKLKFKYYGANKRKIKLKFDNKNLK